MSNFYDLPHRRFNPLTCEWVLVSPQRMMRPWKGHKETEEKKIFPEHRHMFITSYKMFLDKKILGHGPKSYRY